MNFLSIFFCAAFRGLLPCDRGAKKRATSVKSKKQKQRRIKRLNLIISDANVRRFMSSFVILLSDRRRLWNSLFIKSVATGSWQINRVMIQSNSWEKNRCSLCCWANLEVYVEDSRAQLQQDCKLPLENN